jgi:plastocyanin
MASRLRSQPRRLVAVLLTTALTAFGLGASVTSAHADSPPPHHWRVLVGNQSRNMAVQGMRFLPGQVWVDQGDTVTWTANAAEIHTVTFLRGGKKQTSLPPFDPTSTQQTSRTAGRVYNPSKAFNSGVLTTGGPISAFPSIKVYRSYTLKFPQDGTFTYYCLVHGVMMTGTIHVRTDGTPYPFTQAQYDAQASRQAGQLVAHGQKLLTRTAAGASAHHVFAGAEDNKVLVMRFLHGTVHVTVGTKVTFENITREVPHTVTFGREPPGPAVLTPSGDPTHYSGGALNSGILLPGKSFTVTFTKAGTFPYICALHDTMGMKGKVVVG